MSFEFAAKYLTREAMAVARGNTSFALDLYQQLRHNAGNLFFSPYSISTALAMTYAGARGDTATQMAQTLHFPLAGERLHEAFAALGRLLNAVQERGDVLLSVANALWPQAGYHFLASFLDLVKRFYGLSITPLDFAEPDKARAQINAWVEEETGDKIKELIRPGMLDSLTRLVLTNAIYFKGNWAHPFDRAKTKQAPFWLTAKRAVDVPMMAQKQDFEYAETAELQMLSLPYVGGALSMVLLLPREMDGLARLEDALTTENLKAWGRYLSSREVEVFLPRFELGSTFNLSGVLTGMGMRDAFGEEADFSGMTGGRDLYISEVVHKAYVAVNEEGTEAAAATAVLMARMALPPCPATFKADHPFIFLIRDNFVGGILFLGRVVAPTALNG